MSEKNGEAERQTRSGMKRSIDDTADSESSDSIKKVVPEDDQQTEPECTTESAMSNDLILESIFKHLSTQDLIRNCRLVNRQWSLAAGTILKKRSNASVKVKSLMDFVALEDCIEGSADFPFRELDLECTKDAFRIDEWLGWGLSHRYWSFFTRLRLTCWQVPEYVILALLSRCFRHIVSLTLNRIHPDTLRCSDFPDPDWNSFTLKNLKRITFEGGRCEGVARVFQTRLLQSCPNLELVENCTNAHLPALSAVGKLGVVKSLRVCSCINRRGNYPVTSGIEMLIISDGRLEGSNFCHAETVEFSCLLPLLESNRETLRRIEVYNTVVYDHKNCRDDWPKLSKLTSLKILKPLRFPASVNEIFPALNTIELGAYPRDGSFYDRVGGFMWSEALPTVSMLEVFRPCSFSFEDWKCMSQAVPNVRHVYIGYDSRSIGPYDTENPFPPVAHHPHNNYAVDEVQKNEKSQTEIAVPWDGLSCFRHLETLHISPIELPGTNVDSILTGIPDFLVAKLRGNPTLAVAELNERENVALLTGLKELVIGFTMPPKVNQKDPKTNCPVSEVTLKYGLNLLPDELAIRFVYDHWSTNAQLMEEALRPVSSRVTFGHWNASHGYWGMPEWCSGLLSCHRTEHPKIDPRLPWIDHCSRGRRRATARKSTGGVPRHQNWFLPQPH